eukprot:12409042-Heterocapsa_arctica.AAC.1
MNWFTLRTPSAPPRRPGRCTGCLASGPRRLPSLPTDSRALMQLRTRVLLQSLRCLTPLTLHLQNPVRLVKDFVTLVFSQATVVPDGHSFTLGCLRLQTVRRDGVPPVSGTPSISILRADLR